MKKTLILILSSILLINLNAQDDWKLPVHKGKIQFEFNSKKLNSGKKDLCEFYTATNTYIDLTTQLRNAMSKGKVKFFSSTNFSLIPQLSNADANAGNIQSYVLNCNEGNDTLIGSLTINIVQTKVAVVGVKIRSGSIKCLYRIILKDDSYNIKFRGFKYTYRTSPTLLKAAEVKTVPLEEEYDEVNINRSDKKFWSDIKMLVNLYNSTLEEVIALQGSDFDFDD